MACAKSNRRLPDFNYFFILTRNRSFDSMRYFFPNITGLLIKRGFKLESLVLNYNTPDCTN